MSTTESVRPNEADIRVLLEAGCHFGHQTKRWCPKMKPYIFGVRNGIHVIDLDKTWIGLEAAKAFLQQTVAGGRHVLMVGTKKQAQDVVRRSAESVKQPYVVNRWLGGMLTNNRTVRQSVSRMQKLETMERDGSFDKLPKKEVSTLRHELVKLQKNLGGVKDMENLPAALFVIDIGRERLAVEEARKLGIPVVAMVDTNADNVDQIDYVIPSNDDAIRAITHVVEELTKAISSARQEYEQAMVETQRQRAIEDAEAKARQTVVDEQRRTRDREARKQRADAIAKVKASKAAEPAGEATEKAAPPAASPEAAEEGGTKDA